MKTDQDAVIVAMGRTAIGDFGGTLKKCRAHQLGAQVIQAVLAQVPELDPGLLDDVILGDCIQSPDEATTARTTALAAGIPDHVPAVTIQRQCASAMEALAQASNRIRLGDADFILAGGVESMSNAFYCLPTARWGARLKHGVMMDAMWELLHSGSGVLAPPGYIMGQTAENVAEKYQISREDQDTVALRSHHNAEAAIDRGRFKEEIIPVTIPGPGKNPVIFDTDEHVRRGLTMDELSRLPPAFAKNGTVTVGNASGINDGAAICLLASRTSARKRGLPILARIKAHAVSGCDPRIMGIGPVPATRKLFKKTGVRMSDIELIELNEAFASQYIACEKELGLNRDITNVNGSGIGLGHPVGCTGTRIVISLLSEMKRRQLTLGLATLCVGGGMGMSMLIENEA
ncbi:MAG: acetyl-CoA C-acyltransferase [Deltaproteobacteria bacterium]|nr:MAG: acetyl-CoA C-acyltransferase [Deltaproteobacteria bacterium]